MIIQLSNHLKMNVIAEGVETKEQLKVLQNYNCNTVQGYLFSKPLPANQFAELLKKQRIEPILKTYKTFPPIKETLVSIGIEHVTFRLLYQNSSVFYYSKSIPHTLSLN